jgi:hypothetical protein
MFYALDSVFCPSVSMDVVGKVQADLFQNSFDHDVRKLIIVLEGQSHRASFDRKTL